MVGHGAWGQRMEASRRTIFPRAKYPRSPPRARLGHVECSAANFAKSSSSLPISRFHSAMRSSVFVSFPLTRMCDARQMRRSVSCVNFSLNVSRNVYSVATSCLARGWRCAEARSGVGSCSSAAAAPDAQSNMASRKIMAAPLPGGHQRLRLKLRKGRAS
eukprot:scaffold50340_cov63-Phaeocystis_antarctica.AAC.3